MSERMGSRRLRLGAVFLLLALITAGCGGSSDNEAVSGPAAQQPAGQARAGWPTEVVFAAVPAEQSSSLQDSYKTTLDILKRELGIDIEFFQAADYAGVIEAMIAGKVDIAQFGPFSYVVAQANGAKIEPLAGVIKEKGTPPGTSPTALPRRRTARSTASRTSPARRSASSTPARPRASSTPRQDCWRKASIRTRASRASSPEATTHRPSPSPTAAVRPALRSTPWSTSS